MATVSNRPSSGGIGEAVLRKEDAEFITGQGRYVDDLKLPGMLHAAFVRSPFGHALVTGIDASAAEKMPGVVRIITAESLGLAGGVPCGSNPTGTTRQPRHPLLAAGRVRYQGRPVAVGVAADRYAARDAADAVLVDYDPQPAVTDGRAALADGAPRVHDEYDSNLCCTLAHETEGFAEAFARGARVVKSQNFNQRLTPIAMETRGCVADWVTAND